MRSAIRVSLAALTAALFAAGCAHHRTDIAIRPVQPAVPPTADPRSRADSFYEKAVAALAARDYASALDYLQGARLRKADDPRVLNALGVVYDKLGRFDLSARYYAQAAALDPGSPIVAANQRYSQLLQHRSVAAPVEDPMRLASAAAPARAEPQASREPASMRLVAVGPGVVRLESGPAPVPAEVRASAPHAIPIAEERLEIAQAAPEQRFLSGPERVAVEPPSVIPAFAPAAGSEEPPARPIPPSAERFEVTPAALERRALVTPASLRIDVAVPPAQFVTPEPEPEPEPEPRIVRVAGEPLEIARAGPEPRSLQSPAPLSVEPAPRPSLASLEEPAGGAVFTNAAVRFAELAPIAAERRSLAGMGNPGLNRGAPASSFSWRAEAAEPAQPGLVEGAGQPHDLARAASPAPVPQPALVVIAAPGRDLAAKRVKTRLAAVGWTVKPRKGREPLAPRRSVVRYGPGQETIAAGLARTLPFPVVLAACRQGCKGVTLTLGTDTDGSWRRRRFKT